MRWISALSFRCKVNMMMPLLCFGALWGPGSTGAQTLAPFQIVWVVIGEAASVAGNEPAHAGRQLFKAADLVERSLANVKVEQVEVVPVVYQLTVGQRLCLTELDIRAVGAGGHLVQGAPLSVSVRQDHKHHLGLSRSKRDICLRPSEAGEYPLRLTSMLPARDGTTRGAQVYLRVSEPKETNKPLDEAPR
jgi:hypothetical protein